jgi:hypothetical protein
MRFQVPQFTDIEDKIIGPLTLKQFIYLAGSAGVCVVLYTFLPLFIAIILMAPIAGLGLALAFLKIHNRPFIKIMEASFKYIIGDRLYIWRHRPKILEKKSTEEEKIEPTGALLPRLNKSKLKDLTWSLDVKENLTKPVRENKIVR